MNILNNTNKRVLKKYEKEEYFENIFKNDVIKIRENISKVNIKKNEKYFFFIKKLKRKFFIINENKKYILYPDIYNHNLPKDIIINENNLIQHTSFSKVYSFFYPSSLIERKYYIFKEVIIKNNKKEKQIKEYKSFIFLYLIQLYLKMKKSEQMKYLCEIYEIGKIKNNKNFYCIQSYCNENLENFFNNINYFKNLRTKKTDKDKLIFLFDIILQCLNSIKILHDLNFVHLDIKPQNFLINIDQNNINKFQIKIIDFGEIKKIGFKTNNKIGTADYICNDLLINYNEKNKREIEIKKNFDIFSLGCMFIRYLYIYIFNINKIMVCPIINQKIDWEEPKDILLWRKKYNEPLFYNDLEKININLKQLFFKKMKNELFEKIMNIIKKMIHYDNTQRYQEIIPNGIIKDINDLKESFNKNNFENKKFETSIDNNIVKENKKIEITNYVNQITKNSITKIIKNI